MDPFPTTNAPDKKEWNVQLSAEGALTDDQWQSCDIQIIVMSAKVSAYMRLLKLTDSWWDNMAQRNGGEPAEVQKTKKENKKTLRCVAQSIYFDYCCEQPLCPTRIYSSAMLFHPWTGSTSLGCYFSGILVLSNLLCICLLAPYASGLKIYSFVSTLYMLYIPRE